VVGELHFPYTLGYTSRYIAILLCERCAILKISKISNLVLSQILTAVPLTVKVVEPPNCDDVFFAGLNGVTGSSVLPMNSSGVLGFSAPINPIVRPLAIASNKLLNYACTIEDLTLWRLDIKTTTRRTNNRCDSVSTPKALVN
jgi:hypothetical protein